MLNSLKYTFTLFFLFGVITFGLGQQGNSQIVKITYTSSPTSQYRMTEHMIKSTPTKASVHEFMRGITDYYSLYVDLKSRSSVYVLDSTEQIRPTGWEDPRRTAALLDTVLFTVKTPNKKTLKHEWIMNQTFYSEGEVGNIDWELTNEERNIDGLKCKKALAANYPMLTVWYTKELPISNGPSIYQGLPGLVVWAEDYSRTTQMLKIEYTDNVRGFNELYESKYNAFEKEKKNGEFFNKEPILLIKKGDLHKDSYEYFHNKPYKMTSSK